MTTEIKPSNNKKRNTVLAGITVLFLAVGGAYAVYYQTVLAKIQETDNAYVGGNLVNLSSQVTGNVTEIRAEETQMVQAGAPLVMLDAADADVALAQADAKLGAAVRQQRQRYADVAQYDATVALRRLELKSAEDDLARRLPLAADHTISGEEVAHARQAVKNARAMDEDGRTGGTVRRLPPDSLLQLFGELLGETKIGALRDRVHPLSLRVIEQAERAQCRRAPPSRRFDEDHGGNEPVRLRRRNPDPHVGDGRVEDGRPIGAVRHQSEMRRKRERRIADGLRRAAVPDALSSQAVKWRACHRGDVAEIVEAAHLL